MLRDWEIITPLCNNDKLTMNQSEVHQAKVVTLIVDDIPANLNLLREILEPEGYMILGAPSGEIALQITTRTVPNLIILDVAMSGIDGFETCRRLKANAKTAGIPVIFITVKDDPKDIVRGFQAGGVDYITRPVQKEEVIVRVKNQIKINQLTNTLLQRNGDLERRTAELALANQKLQREMTMRRQLEDALRNADERLNIISQREAERWGIEGFVGKSNTICKILDDVRRLQGAEAACVLITGESGTGKELIARAIHFGGSKVQTPFIPVNCTAVPIELAESLLFGHVRGAFTGANAAQKGYFELADGGTLFLDEIGDMPIDLQPKLSRVLEDGVIMPIGATQGKHVSVRVIASTNRDLQSRIAQGLFREDLYFRLARFTVEVPPLRDRPEDIPLLINHFVNIFASETGRENVTLGPDAFSALMQYHFPGNVRELKNIIEHALIKSDSSIIHSEHLRFVNINRTASSIERSGDLEQVSAHLIKRAQVKAGVSSEEIVNHAPVLPGEKGILSPAASSTPLTDEEQILAYLEEHGSISNAECRNLLSVDMQRASYLLKKMRRSGLLKRDGERRWASYRLV